jgi:hypothetical protein
MTRAVAKGSFLFDFIYLLLGNRHWLHIKTLRDTAPGIKGNPFSLRRTLARGSLRVP